MGFVYFCSVDDDDYNLAEMRMGIISAAQSRNHANSPGERRGEFSPSDITALQRFMSEGWKCRNMP